MIVTLAIVAVYLLVGACFAMVGDVWSVATSRRHAAQLILIVIIGWPKMLYDLRGTR